MKQPLEIAMWTFTMVLVSASAGCVPREARDGAKVLAVYTQQVNELATRFADQQTAIDRASQQVTNDLEDSALVTEQNNDAQNRRWTIATDPRASLYQQVREGVNSEAASRDALLKARSDHDKLVEDTESGVADHSKQLSAVAQALGKLSSPRSTTDEMQFLVGYFSAVRDQMKKDKADAEAAANKAKANLDNKAKKKQ